VNDRKPYNELQRKVQTQARRMKQAEEKRSTVLAYASSIGVLGLVFVLPVIGGAYLGRWLDSLIEGYSLRWTLGFMFLGILIGAFNVYFLVRDHG
jgi:ATP synthase protein I